MAILTSHQSRAKLTFCPESIIMCCTVRVYSVCLHRRLMRIYVWPLLGKFHRSQERLGSQNEGSYPRIVPE